MEEPIDDSEKDTTPVKCCSCGGIFPRNETMAHETDYWCFKCFNRESDYLFEEED